MKLFTKLLQDIFKTLGDESRLKIIAALNDTEKSVSEIANKTELGQSLVSHHLKTLRQNLIVNARRKGPYVFYYISDKRILKILQETSNIFVDLIRKQIEHE